MVSFPAFRSEEVTCVSGAFRVQPAPRQKIFRVRPTQMIFNLNVELKNLNGRRHPRLTLPQDSISRFLIEYQHSFDMITFVNEEIVLAGACFHCIGSFCVRSIYHTARKTIQSKRTLRWNRVLAGLKQRKKKTPWF